MRNRALITGITGQDGSYLSELLLEKGYDVHGLARRTSSISRDRIDAIRDQFGRRGAEFGLHYADMGDAGSLTRILQEIQPDEIYNFASQAHVGVSFQQPEYTADVNGTAVLRLLEIVRSAKMETRFYQASSSELFGDAVESPQTESTPFNPVSPYAVSKQFAYSMVRTYRSAFGLYASNGILYNHESPRRGENFVTRKITLTLAQIASGADKTLALGNLDATRDWGHAADYVRAMWLILQHAVADDFVIATGVAHSVRDFVVAAGNCLGFEIEWQGEGVEERGINRSDGRVLVEVNPDYYRPIEGNQLVGDPSKAKEVLDWTPTITWEQMIEEMVRSDLQSCGSG